MSKFYIHKKSKKGKTLTKKLNTINEAVRDRIIKSYIEKCTIEYNIKFNKWRIRIFGENSGVDKEAMQTRLDILKKKENFLY